MKRWIRNTLTIGLCLIPVAAIVGFSNSWVHKLPISCVGSSGVKPFVEQISKGYQIENKKVDITVEAGGSGFGIEQVADGYANIGNASKDPHSALADPKADPSIRDKWIDNQIKTVTIGWEAICNVFIPPVNFEYKGEMDSNNILVVNDESIKNFMRIFSGIPDGIHWEETVNYNVSDNKLPDNSMWYFRNHKFDNDWTAKDKQLLQSTSIIPYVRSGGSLTSGTASSFVGSSRLNFKEDPDLTPDQRAAFNVGNYGTSFGLQQTDEANSRAWDMFSKSNKPGQVVYLSSGFVCSPNNDKLIKDKKYGIMAYQHAVNDKVVPFAMKDVNQSAGGYNWFRPLNCLFSLKSKNEEVRKFVQKLIDKSDTVPGCRALDPDKERNQLKPFDSSDVQIAKDRYGIDKDKLWDSEWEVEGKEEKISAHFAVTPLVDLVIESNYDSCY